MDELFRFVVLRPLPEPAAEGEADAEDTLRSQLADARSAPEPAQAMRETATRFTESGAYVGKADELTTLTSLANRLEEVDPAAGPAAQTPADKARAALGEDPSAVRQSDAYRAERRRLGDTLLAIKLVHPPDADVAGLLRLARAAQMVDGLAAHDPALETTEGFVRAREGPVAVAPDVLPVPSPPMGAPSPSGGAEPEGGQAEAIRQLEELQTTLQILNSRAASEADSEPAARTGSSSPSPAQPIDRSDRDVALQALVSREQRSVTRVDITEPVSRAVLGSAEANLLPTSVRELLTTRGLDPATSPMHVMTQGIKDLIWERIDEVHDPVVLGPILRARFDLVTDPGPHDEATDPPPAAMVAPPGSHGQVKPAGVADLLVVRQHTVGYSMGDVAFVENVAPREKLTRWTRRAETAETTVTVETETVQEQERDQQSTERFDLAREAGSVLRSDSARMPGSPSTQSYGTLVESGGSQESSTRDAATFGRDVTSRAVGRITQRARMQTTQRTVHEFAEQVTHELDNSAGASAQIRVYQWLDRVVRSQIFSYGQRLFYDLVVPEPAALVLRAIARRTPGPGPLVKPAPFTLKPADLNEWNYGWYVAGYGATGVTPPPAATVYVGTSFTGNAGDINSDQISQRQVTKADKTMVTIPEGYQAIRADLRLTGSFWTNADSYNTFQILLGARIYTMFDKWRMTVTMNGETGQIPVSMVTATDMFVYAANVEIACEPTETAVARWQLATHAAIGAAAKQRMAEYEERYANLQASLRMQALSLTADRKAAMEREELQRACLAVLTNQQFDGLSAIEHSPEGYPQPFLPNVEPLGRYVRFLQQAFEWEQMAWHYYAYFWGRKPYWLEKLLLDDADGRFRDFLRAGSARVLVPVRPGFEPAVAHFMDTGEVPTSAELAQIVSPLYLPLLTETLGATTSIEDAVPVGEPWEVRLPATLIKLRTSDTLPTWTSKAGPAGTLVWEDGAGDPL